MTRELHFQAIKNHRRGFTLMEGLIASVVLAILALGVIGSLSTAYEQSQYVHDQATSLMLGRQLMDEIVSKSFSSTNPLGTGGTRSTFANVSAYNSYSDTSTSMPLLGGGSLDVTGSEPYTRSVSVATGTKPSIDSLSPSTDFAIVTVTVTCPNGQTVSIPELVAKYSIQR
jgi:prepilin-type N-terminal cleavage/methylation domain-containing protein